MVNSNFQKAVGALERVETEKPLTGELCGQAMKAAPSCVEYAGDERDRQIMAMDLSVEGVLTMMGASEIDLASCKAMKAELSSEELAAIYRRQGVSEQIIAKG